MTEWSISVKTVGGGGVRSSSDNSNDEVGLKDPPSCAGAGTGGGDGSELVAAKKEVPSNFTVSVKADDRLSSLHERIEEVTGLKACQQRLIYRGRLMNQSEDVLGEVPGLCDGQTIHLVPRPADPERDDDDATDSNHNTNNNTSDSPPDAAAADGGSVSASASSLLATLLGLGVSGAFSSSNGDDDDETVDDAPRARALASLRPTGRGRSVRAAARRAASRSAADRASDLEPVRQGLLTLHTMLDCTPAAMDEQRRSEARANEEEEPRPSQRRPPHHQGRRWRRGQWLDVKDTVEQWLEATVVETVRPRDVLSVDEYERVEDENAESNGSRARRDDPIVGADDLEGRRSLLLDEANCLRDDPDSESVQLLLVHYNGWPHRWDEWIRSDSDRIRTFRTRTRHNTATTPFASPTPNSIFSAAPSTHIREDDRTDRRAVLPELRAVVESVRDVLDETIPRTTTSDDDNDNRDASPHLPWRCFPDVDYDDAPRPNQLRALAPLLDRLGRVLCDAAPHVAALAAEDNEVGSGPAAPRNDFSHGVVNTDENFNVRRTRSTASAAAASGSVVSASTTDGATAGDGEERVPGLARLLRVGDNNGGIDIHIHAIVTPVEGGAGAAGAFPFPMGLSTTPTNATTTTTIASTATGDDGAVSAPTLWREDEDDMELFSDLYTETPPPFRFDDPATTEEEERNHEAPARSLGVGDIPVNPDEDNDIVLTSTASPSSPLRCVSTEEAVASTPTAVPATTAAAVVTPSVVQDENGSSDRDDEEDDGLDSCRQMDKDRKRKSRLGRFFKRSFRRSKRSNT